MVAIILLAIAGGTIVGGSSHKKTVEVRRDDQGTVVETKTKTTKSVGLSGTVVPLTNAHASIHPELSNSTIEVTFMDTGGSTMSSLTRINTCIT